MPMGSFLLKELEQRFFCTDEELRELDPDDTWMQFYDCYNEAAAALKVECPQFKSENPSASASASASASSSTATPQISSDDCVSSCITASSLNNNNSNSSNNNNINNSSNSNSARSSKSSLPAVTHGGTAPVSSKKMKRRRESRGPRYAFKTRSEKDVIDDGYKWRKYGRKSVKSSPYPRNYYKCSEGNCGVKKRVERDPIDETMVITTYEGTHNHESPSVIYYYLAEPVSF